MKWLRRRSRTFIGSIAGLSLLLAMAAHAQQQRRALITGGSYKTVDATDMRVTRLEFGPNARTVWHSHDKGQLLMSADGKMRIQLKGQPVREVGPGEPVYTPPNVMHWHGATPGASMTQVTVFLGAGSSEGADVTDAEYSAKPR